MANRMLITKVVRTEANRADLYGRGHQWPDLKLFDLGELAAVGIDPAGLQIGQETPARFWALWEPSEKLNAAGNPYKNIVGLEPGQATAPTEAPDLGEILAELRAIRALLQVMATAQGLQASEPSEPSELDRTFPRYGDGSTLGDNPAELAAYNAHLQATGKPPATVQALRLWYKGQNGNGG